MTAVIVQYPLDPSGTSPTNLVKDDVIPMVKRKVRAVAATYGAFFKDTLKVYDAATQRLLIEGRDYYAAEEYALPTARYGKSICAVVVVLDETVGDKVSLSYQALGGDFSTPATNVVQVLQSLNLDDRKASWAPIVPKPAATLDETSRAYQGTERFTFEHMAFAIDRLAYAMARGDEVAHEALYLYIEANRGKVTPDLLTQIQLELNSGIGAHVATADPHPQYYKKTDQVSVAVVRQPTNLTPPAAAEEVSPMTPFAADAYRSLYRLAQAGAHFQVSKTKDFSSGVDLDVIIDGSVTSYTQPVQKLSTLTLYYWRVQYKNVEGQWSPWSIPTGFTTSDFGVVRPGIVSPQSGTTVTTSTPVLQATDFKIAGAIDTHASSDWEIWTGPDGTGTRLWGIYGDTVNKTSIQVAGGRLPNKVKVYPRVRYNSAVSGSSPWSFSATYDMNYPTVPTVIGQTWEGGVYMGNIAISSGDRAGTWAIIVAPKAGGETALALNATSLLNVVADTKDSVGNNLALVAAGSPAAIWADNLTLNAYSDWVIPAKDVLSTILANAAKLPSGYEFTQNSAYWSSSHYSVTTTTTVDNPDTPIYGTGITQSYGQHTLEGYYSENGDLVAKASCSVGQILWEGNTSSPAINPRTGKQDSYQRVVWECVQYGQVIVGYEDGGTHEESSTAYYSWSGTLYSASANVTNTLRTTSLNVRAVRFFRMP